jgi:hypothetical protein
LDTLQGGVVHWQGKLFGSFYAVRKGWAALDARTGEVLYDFPDAAKGAVLVADGRLYALCEDGWMLLLEPGEKSFVMRGRFRLVEARPREARRSSWRRSWRIWPAARTSLTPGASRKMKPGIAARVRVQSSACASWAETLRGSWAARNARIAVAARLHSDFHPATKHRLKIGYWRKASSGSPVASSKSANANCAGPPPP